MNRDFHYFSGETIQLQDRVRDDLRHFGYVAEVIQPGSDTALTCDYPEGGVVTSWDMQGAEGRRVWTPPDGEFWEDLKFIGREHEVTFGPFEGGTRMVKPTIHARTTVIVGVVIAVLLFLLSWQSWNYFRLRLESALAEEQTRMFDELRALAMQRDATGAAGCLQHVFIYYPSGSKQRKGSHLDLTVERHRNAVARDIIVYLRKITGQDLGDKPESWIGRFAEPN